MTYAEKVEKLNAEWRAMREAPLTQCQASISDGECYHPKCPNKGQRKRCRLPWQGRAGYDDDDGDYDELE